MKYVLLYRHWFYDIRDDYSCFTDVDVDKFEEDIISKSYIMKDEKNLGPISNFDFSSISAKEQVSNKICEVQFEDPTGMINPTLL